MVGTFLSIELRLFLLYSVHLVILHSVKFVYFSKTVIMISVDESAYSYCILWIIISRIFFLALSQVCVTECISRCSFGTVPSVETSSLSSSRCLVQMPDNPIQHQNNILPCQIFVKANCTRFCHINLNFSKFHLPSCDEHVMKNLETIQTKSLLSATNITEITYKNTNRDYCKHVDRYYQ